MARFMQAMTGGDYDGSGLGMNTILAQVVERAAYERGAVRVVVRSYARVQPNKVHGEVRERMVRLRGNKVAI